jgi:hypothetical protein
MYWKVFYIYWITFQTLLDVKLIYLKRLHINTTYTFNINLVYQMYEHQNQGLVMPKLAPISLVLPLSHCHFYVNVCSDLIVFLCLFVKKNFI